MKPIAINPEQNDPSNNTLYQTEAELDAFIAMQSAGIKMDVDQSLASTKRYLSYTSASQDPARRQGYEES